MPSLPCEKNKWKNTLTKNKKRIKTKYEKEYERIFGKTRHETKH
jgi:hypothetical protein